MKMGNSIWVVEQKMRPGYGNYPERQKKWFFSGKSATEKEMATSYMKYFRNGGEGLGASFYFRLREYVPKGKP